MGLQGGKECEAHNEVRSKVRTTKVKTKRSTSYQFPTGLPPAFVEMDTCLPLAQSAKKSFVTKT